MTSRAIVVAFILLGAAALTAQSPRERNRAEKPAEYSPLGFYDLRAFEQAYPAAVGHPLVVRATGEQYWAFRGSAFRGGTNAGAIWTSLGPETSIQDPNSGSSENISGRVAALAISPACTTSGRCRAWVATAGGGVWRTDDALNTSDVGWRWMSQGVGTNNPGSLGLDPNDATGNTIYVGTGETNSPNNSGAGTGVYRSINGGDVWTRVSTMILDPVVSSQPIDFTYTRGISAVVVPPGSPQTIYVATTTAILGMTGVRGGQVQSNGLPQPRPALYKTENGGSSWTMAWLPPQEPIVVPNPNLSLGVVDTMIGVRDVKLDPRDPRVVYVTAFNNAVHRSAPSLENGDASFKPVFAIVGGALFRDLAMFDLAVSNGRMRIYAYNGTESLAPQSLYRLDNADVPAASLVNTSGIGLVNTAAWEKMSSDDLANPRSVSRRMCSSQCFYDLVVATPAGQPDTVIIGGVASLYGDATIRSTDGGETFQSFGDDAQNPRASSHVDVRAVAFHPKNPRIAFVGSDGGVVRNDGNFSNISSRCNQLFNNPPPTCSTVLREVPTRIYFLNKGLQTLQFYNIALDPAAPLTRMIGGLQDNSTIWLDGSGIGNGRVWKTLFPGGDGTSASGFHPTRSNVTFASFQSNRFFTNFRNGDVSQWVRTDDPIRAAAERETITSSTGRQFLSFDVVNPDTQFTGFQHVWRTKNNGGAQAQLEASCRFSAASQPTGCGDWVPLGVAVPFPAGSTAASPSRFPGDLTSTFYGSDRSGGLIVAAERARTDAGTLWAATSFGRLFVSKNADAAGAAVTFARIDSPATPNRFVTRIVVDRNDPNVALISYSGFNAITPSTPGHIFRATYRPGTGTATFEVLDADLGDLPINTIAFDDARGDLYAGTDFGPLLLRRGTTTWELAGIGFPEALMVDLEIVIEQRLLVGATHGLGIFYLRLPK
jgi:hypothetical protein